MLQLGAREVHDNNTRLDSSHSLQDVVKRPVRHLRLSNLSKNGLCSIQKDDITAHEPYWASASLHSCWVSLVDRPLGAVTSCR